MVSPTGYFRTLSDRLEMHRRALSRAEEPGSVREMPQSCTEGYKMYGRMRQVRAGRLARKLCVAVLAAAGAAATAQAAVPQPQFFDWSVPAETGGPNYTPSPFLT